MQNEEEAMAGLTEHFFLFSYPLWMPRVEETCLQVKEGFYCILAKREVQSNFLSLPMQFFPELLEFDDTDFAHFLKYAENGRRTKKMGDHSLTGQFSL